MVTKCPELCLEWGWEEGRLEHEPGTGVCLGETNGLGMPLLVDRSCLSWPVLVEPGEGGTPTSGVTRGEIGVKLKARRLVLGLGGTTPFTPEVVDVWSWPDKTDGVSNRTLRRSSSPTDDVGVPPGFFLAASFCSSRTRN